MLGTSRVVAAVLASVLLVSPALAQPAPTASQKQQAQDLVKQAITKSQAKEHDDAIELYLKAYAIVPLPTLLSNVGAEYRAADKPVEALKYFCMYLEKDPTGTLQTYAKAQARELQDTLGQQELDVCAPLPEAKPPIDEGTDEGTGVTGTTGLTATAPTPAAADPGKGLKIAGLVTGGVGVVALGAGVLFGLKAKRISDDITNQPVDEMWRTAIDEYEAEGQTAENYQIVSLIAGGALVTGGVILYVLGRSKTASASREQMTVGPTASADGGGLVLSGRF